MFKAASGLFFSNYCMIFNDKGIKMFHVKHFEEGGNPNYIENVKKQLSNLMTSRWCVRLKESFSRLFTVLEKEQRKIVEVPVDQISPSPYQPRTIFDDQRLDELCQTIRVHGVIQPIVVRKLKRDMNVLLERKDFEL